MVENELTWYEAPDLERPLLLLAFEGMFDAAEAATSALHWIQERTDSQEVAMIDPEAFFNFQEVRPSVRLKSDGNRVIEWPATEVFSSHTSGKRDLVLMTGIEPHLRWPTFADYVVEVAQRSGCEMVVTVGSFVGMVPHTRPFSVTGSAVNSELARRLGLKQPSYQGPTGVLGVINERFERTKIPVISLRVEIPHYVPGAPNPKAMRALLRRLEQTTGIPTDYEQLDSEVNEWLERVDVAVSSDTDSSEYVERLERHADSAEELLPSGDDLAAELEAFLRDPTSTDGVMGSADTPSEDLANGSSEASADNGETDDSPDDDAIDDLDS